MGRAAAHDLKGECGEMPIIIRLDVEMAKKKISLSDLAERIDLSPDNLSILKNDRAKAIRFSTLEAICRELNCQPGDILEYTAEDDNNE
jgi:putative transcriptional regulator